jgi:hypothetical protein
VKAFWQEQPGISDKNLNISTLLQAFAVLYFSKPGKEAEPRAPYGNANKDVALSTPRIIIITVYRQYALDYLLE